MYNLYKPIYKLYKTFLDSSQSIQGIKFEFDQAIEGDDDAMHAVICVNNINDVAWDEGWVAFYGVGTYDYTCDEYHVPNFCEGMFIIHIFLLYMSYLSIYTFNILYFHRLYAFNYFT